MIVLEEPIYETSVPTRNDYNFKLTASLYATHWDYDGERAYVPVRKGNILGVAVLMLVKDHIHIEIFSERRDDEFIEEALRVTDHVMALGEDLREFYDLVRDDPLLAIINGDLRGLHMRAMQSIWEGLLVGICQQNASFRQGWLMVTLLRGVLGSKVFLKKYGHKIALLPTPSEVIARKDLLRSTRAGYRTSTILECARSFSKESIEPERLEELRGIGQYTARIARILALRKYDEFPVDRWFARLIPNAYFNVDETWPIEKVEKFARERWGKYMGLAAIFITAVIAAETIGDTLKRIHAKNINPFPNKPSPFTLWRYAHEWVKSFT